MKIALTKLHIGGGAASEKLLMYSKDLEIITGGGIKIDMEKSAPRCAHDMSGSNFPMIPAMDQ